MKNAESMKRPPASDGIVVFGVLLIVSSLMHIQKLIADRELCFHYYSYYPAWLSVTRYLFSWFQRIIGIAAAVGILMRKEIARKLAFAIGWFTVLAVYWKHPYAAVKLQAEYLDKQFGYLLELTGTGVTFSSITPFTVIALCAWDIMFWAALFYFFTRPSVKTQFKSCGL